MTDATKDPFDVFGGEDIAKDPFDVFGGDELVKKSDYEITHPRVPTRYGIDIELQPLVSQERALASHEQEKNERLRALYEIAKTPDRALGELNLLRQGVPPDISADFYDELHKSFAAKSFDPQKWRDSNPGLYKWVDEDWRRANVALKEEKLSQLGARVKYLLAMNEHLDTILGDRDIDYFTLPLIAEGDQSAKISKSEARVLMLEKQANLPEWLSKGMLPDTPLREAVREHGGIRKTLQQKVNKKGTDAIADQWGTARLGSELNKLWTVQARLDWDLYLAEKKGDNPLAISKFAAAALENEKKIRKLQEDIGVQRDYGYASSEWWSTAIEGTQGIASQVDSMQALGVGGGGGALVGAGVGFAVAKGKGAQVGWRIGAKIGAMLFTFGQSYRLEHGALYGELRDMKDDDGNPIDLEVVRGVAFVGGLMKAGIELAELGIEVRALGLGNLLAAPKKTLRDAFSDTTKRAMLVQMSRAITKQLVRGGTHAIGEAVEEGSQELVDIGAGWVAPSISSGKMQEFDVPSAGARVAESAKIGFLVGGMVSSTTGLPVSVASEGMRIHRSRRNALKMHAAADILLSDAAKSAPEDISRLIEIETGMKRAYVDPKALTVMAQSNGEDVDAMATRLLGENGPDRMRRAIAEWADKPGQRNTLEVSGHEISQSWDEKYREVLLQDAVMDQGDITGRELSTLPNRVWELAQDAGQGMTIEEEEFVRAYEDQAFALGTMSREEARLSTAPMRAMIRVTTEHNPQAAADWFSRMTISLGRGELISEGLFKQRAEQRELGLPDQAALFYRDQITGLLNERGAELREQDPARPMTARFSIEGKKFINDLKGHKAVDGMLRVAGQVVAGLVPDGVKRGGGIEVDVRDQAHADEIAKAMEAALDPNGKIRVLATAVNRADTTEETGRQLGIAHDARELMLVGESKFADRDQAPVGYGQDLGGLNELAADWTVAAEQEMTGFADITAAHETAAEKLGATEVTFGTFQEDSGLLNQLGFERTRKGKAFTASSDIRGFRKCNDTFGRKPTDMLIALVSEAMAISGGRFDAAHPHGDEFGASHNDQSELDDYMGSVQEELDSWVIVGRSATGSGYSVLDGIQMAYGIGKDFDTADRVELARAKSKQGDARAARAFDTRAEAVEFAQSTGKLMVDLGAVRSRFDQRQVLAASRRQTRRLLSETDARTLAIDSPHLENLANLVAQNLNKKPVASPTFRSYGQAWRAIEDVSFIDTSDPSEQANHQFRKAMVGEATMPGPFPGGMFDEVNKELELKGKKKVTCSQHAFHLLMARAEGSLAQRAEAVVDFLNENVDEYDGKLKLPEEYLQASVEREVRQQEIEFWNDRDRGRKFYQPAVTETLYQPAQRETPEFQRWFGESKVVDEDGKPKRVYHGTARPDRVGEKFRKSRATSGPSAFFTDNPEIASNYATGKQDTSFETPDSYAGWYKLKIGRSKYDIDRAWYALPHEQRQGLAAKLPHVVRDDDGDADTFSLTADDYGLTGKDHWDWVIKEKRGNVLAAAVDVWLDSAGLYDEEELFGKVLQAAGLENYEYDPPNRSEPAVVPVYLSIKNPLDTSAIPEDVITALEKRSRRQRPIKQKRGADNWDKMDIEAWDWVDQLKRDLEAGTTNVWTRIPDWVTKTLREKGYDGIKDTGGKYTGIGHTVWVPFEPTQIKSATGNRGTFDPDDPNILRQDEDGTRQPRGILEITKDGLSRAFKILVTKDSDLSTLLHEQGHIFLEMMSDLAAHAQASERLTNDFDSILKWLGAANVEGMTREQKEKFARGIEAFFMEGETPSVDLAEPFAAFRLWLTKIYGSVATLNVELDSEVREVFDRMLATDEAIKQVSMANGLATPPHRDHVQAGMTPQEWEDYTAKRQGAERRAAIKVQKEIAKAKKKALKAMQRKEAKRLKDVAKEEWDARQDASAWAFVRHGMVEGKKDRTQGKLDRAAVGEAVGENHPALKDLGGRLVKKNGLHPAAVAEAFGYETTRHMFDALAQLPDEKQWIKQRTDQLVREDNPDIDAELRDLDQLIDGVLHDAETLDMHKQELGEIAKNKEIAKQSYDRARIAARGVVAKTAIGGLRPGSVRNSELSAAKAVAWHTARGEKRDAFLAKLRQIYLGHKWRELRDAMAERERFLKLANGLTDDKARGRLGTASPTFRDVVDTLLESIGLKPLDPYDTEPRAGVSSLLSEMDAAGVEVAFDTELIEALSTTRGKKNWRDLTVEEMQEVHKALKNIRRAASHGNNVKVGEATVERNVVVENLILEATDNLPDIGPKDSEAAMTLLDYGMRYAQALDAFLLRETTVLDWLGGENVNSTWYKAIVQPLKTAIETESDMTLKYTKPLVEVMEAIPEETRARWSEKINANELFPGHRDDLKPARRFEVLMMLLNIGTESSVHRLTEGRGITLDEIEAAVARLGVTKKELEWVQSIWDASEKLWPLARDLEERSSGVRPQKLQRRVFTLQTVDGPVEMKGGYFPAVYDRDITTAGQKQEAETIAGMLPIQMRPTTKRSHLKKRVEGFSDAIDLSPSGIQAGIINHIHDIAFREPIRNVAGLLLDERVRATLNRRIGIERTRALKQWLVDASRRDAAMSDRHAPMLSRAARKIKSNLTVSILGHAVDNFVADPLNQLTVQFTTKVKARNSAGGLMEYMAHPVATRKFAIEKSGALRQRDVEITNEFYRKTSTMGKSRVVPLRMWRFYRDTGFWTAQMIDKGVSTSIWMGAYRQAAKEGKADAEAVQFADMVIRQTMPSTSIIDMAPIQRSQGFLSSLNMFYGYFSLRYQQVRRLAHNVYIAKHMDRSLPKEFAKSLGSHLAMLVITRLIAGIIIGKGPEPEDGEDPGERWLNWALRGLAVGNLEPLPLGVSFAVEEKLLGRHYGGRPIPLASALDASYKASTKAYAALAEDGDPIDAAIAGARAIGMATGTPTRPLRGIEYMLRLADPGSGVEARGPLDVGSGLVYGHRQRQSENLLSLGQDILSY